MLILRCDGLYQMAGSDKENREDEKQAGEWPVPHLTLPFSSAAHRTDCTSPIAVSLALSSSLSGAAEASVPVVSSSHYTPVIATASLLTGDGISELASGISRCVAAVFPYRTVHHSTDTSPRVGSWVVRVNPLRFLAGCRKRRLNRV